MGRRIVVQEGDRYHRWTIIKEVESSIQPNGKRRRMVLAECDCGTVKGCGLDSLRSGASKSCGCLAIEATIANGKANATHGCSQHPAYSAWVSMVSRCKESSDQSADYYHRGIRVCSDWADDPVNFCNWASGNGHQSGLELDRTDNRLGYSPENCRWVTKAINLQNTRSSYWWHIKERVFPSARLAAEWIGVKKSMIEYRARSDSFPEFRKVKKY